MEKPGRKSSAELGVVTNFPNQRRPPPDELTKPQAEVWREVVATRPPDWFTSETVPLLVEYCRVVIEARRIAQLLDGISLKRPSAASLAKYEKFMKLRAQNAATMKSLATAMRLTQQSRYGARGAESHAKKAGSAPQKPWETADRSS